MIGWLILACVLTFPHGSVTENLFLKAHQAFWGNATACYPISSVAELFTAYPSSINNYTRIRPDDFKEIKGRFGHAFPGTCLYSNSSGDMVLGKGNGYPACSRDYCGWLYTKGGNITLNGLKGTRVVQKNPGYYVDCSPIHFLNDSFLVYERDGINISINLITKWQVFAYIRILGPAYADPGYFFLSNGTYSNFWNETEEAVALGHVLPIGVPCRNIRPRFRWSRRTLSKEFCDGVTSLTIDDYNDGKTYGYILASMITLGGTTSARASRARQYFGCKLQILSNTTLRSLSLINQELGSLRVFSEQNRYALDFYFAQQGGVCATIEKHCVMGVMNTEGNITAALTEMKENLRGLTEGVGGWDMWNWLTSWGGKWFAQLLHGLIIVAVVILGIYVLMIFIKACIFKICRTNVPVTKKDGKLEMLMTFKLQPEYEYSEKEYFARLGQIDWE